MVAHSLMGRGRALEREAHARTHLRRVRRSEDVVRDLVPSRAPGRAPDRSSVRRALDDLTPLGFVAVELRGKNRPGPVHRRRERPRAPPSSRGEQHGLAMHESSSDEIGDCLALAVPGSLGAWLRPESGDDAVWVESASRQRAFRMDLVVSEVAISAR